MRALEVSYKEISQLNDVDLTQLLKKLLHQEADKNEIQEAHIDVKLNINVSDEGKDGLISWDKGPTKTKHIPSRLTCFQCKATDMPKAKCKAELLKKSKSNEPVELKSAIYDVLSKGGTYVLFYNKSTTEPGNKSRIKKMREALQAAKFPNYRRANFEVYDAECIANWVNEYLPIQFFVWECLHHQMIPGIKSWDEWSRNPKFSGKYVKNSYLDQKIQLIQNESIANQKILRIKGPSGTGKTRLVFESFRPPAEADIDQFTIYSKVIYMKSNFGPRSIQGFVSELVMRGAEAIIVIDDCPINLHYELTEVINERESKLSLITIDFTSDISPKPITTEILLEPSNLTEVVSELIKSKYPAMHESVVHKIEKFAQGFPEIAVLVADAQLAGSDRVGFLDNTELIRKLLGGTQSLGSDEYEVMKACSIFEYIGFSGRAEAQYKYVASKLCGINERAFYRICRRYIADQRVFQIRGNYLFVTPIPLAITLAVEWWTEAPPDLILDILESLDSVGLVKSFCNQFKYLSFSDKAQETVEKLCGPSYPFGQAETLKSEKGSRVLRAFVEVNPDATSRALYREFHACSIEDLLEIDDGRRNLIWALEKLCWWEDTFNEAAYVMLCLAAAENESYGNNATSQFLQLFHLYLPGTKQPLEQRFRVIEVALDDEELKKQIIAVKALVSGLKGGQFNRSGGPEEQGARAPEHDYHPKDWPEVHAYRHKCLDMLAEIACSDKDELAEIAKEGIANNLFTLVQERLFSKLDDVIRRIVKETSDYWPKAYERIKEVNTRSHNDMNDSEKKMLEDWIQLLTPDDIISRVKLVITNPPYEHEQDKSGKWIDKSRIYAEEFAQEVANSGVDWSPVLKVISEGEQRQGFNFGAKAAEIVEQPNSFISIAIEVLLNPEIINPNAVVLSGFLSKSSDKVLVKQTYEEFFTNPSLQKLSIELVRLSMPDLDDLKRLLELARDGVIETSRFDNFAYNSVLYHLEPDDVIQFCNELSQVDNNGLSCAFNILYMYSFSKSESFDQLMPTFRKWLITYDTIHEVENGILDQYHWEEIVKKLLSCEPRDDELAIYITKQFTKNIQTRKYLRRLYLKEISAILLMNYLEKVWPLVSEALLSEDDYRVDRIIDVLGSDSIFSVPGPICEVDDIYLLKWCKADERAPLRLLEMLPYFDTRVVPTNKKPLNRDAALSLEEPEWLPITYKVIERYGETAEVRNHIEGKMIHFSWGGSPLPYYHQLLNLLDRLLEIDNPKIRSWGRSTIELVNKVMKANSDRMIEHDLGIY